MPHFSSWKRIEPHAHTVDVAPGLSAQIADPLWLLLRQWQLGELTGDDGGSPVAVDVATSWSRFTRFQGHGTDGAGVSTGGPVVTLTEGDGPLERIVEQEPPQAGPGPAEPATTAPSGPWLVAIQAGRALRRHLEARDVGDVATRLMDVVPETVFRASGDIVQTEREGRYARLLTRHRTLDGLAALAFVKTLDLPAEVVGMADRTRVDAAIAQWRAELEDEWCLGADGPVSSSWVAERMEYSFSVAAPPLPHDDLASTPEEDGREVVLRAGEYNGAGLSWYSLDVDTDPQASLGAVADAGGPHAADASGEGPTGQQVRTVLPTPLRFPGMPADRYWELEDARVALGDASAGPTDLARLLATDFAVVYSPDWFLAPVELPVGSVARVDWVVVRDTFGTATLVGTSATSAADAAGRLFQPATAKGRETGDVPLLAVLPSALGPLGSEPLEEVALQRDEAANVAWAIETRVLGPLGTGVDVPWTRTEFDLPPAASSGPSELVWRLSTPVARSWTPLVAVRQGVDERPVLRRARLLDSATNTVREARSRIMRGVRDVCDEEITRSGITVRMVDQLARGHDGSTSVWRGRTKLSWKGEAYSGLEFDATTPGNTAP